MAARQPEKQVEFYEFPFTMEDKIISFDVAIEKKSAPVEYLIDVIRGVQSENTAEREFYSKYYQGILEAFQSEWGEIEYKFVLRHHALILTKKGHLFHEEANPDLASLELIHRCDVLKNEAHRLLNSNLLNTKNAEKDLMNCMGMIAELLSHLFGSLENVYHKQKKIDEHNILVTYLKKELDILEANFVQCSRRRARYEYTNGMFRGLLIAVSASIVLSIGLYIFNVGANTIVLFLGSLCMGGVGAIISVMTRMSNLEKEEFTIDHLAGPYQNRLLGLYRPIIGATMGVILYFLTMSSLLPLNVPENGDARLFFILIISFSAGFTERWAQDMLPGSKDKKPSEKTEGQKISEGSPN